MESSQSRAELWRRRAVVLSYLCVAAGLIVVIGNAYLFGAAQRVATWGVGLYAFGLGIHAAAPLARFPASWIGRFTARTAVLTIERETGVELPDPTAQ